MIGIRLPYFTMSAAVPMRRSIPIGARPSRHRLRHVCRGSKKSGGFGPPPPPPPPPSPDEVKKNASSAKFDAMAAQGLPVYEVFVRLTGDADTPTGKCQWFPVGPMSVDEDNMIHPAVRGAKKDIDKAAYKMYPSLRIAQGRKLEYGYRSKAERKLSEAEIKAGGDPFQNVKLVPPKPDGEASPKEDNPFVNAMNSFENFFTSRGR